MKQKSKHGQENQYLPRPISGLATVRNCYASGHWYNNYCQIFSMLSITASLFCCSMTRMLPLLKHSPFVSRIPKPSQRSNASKNYPCPHHLVKYQVRSTTMLIFLQQCCWGIPGRYKLFYRITLQRTNLSTWPFGRLLYSLLGNPRSRFCLS